MIKGARGYFEMLFMNSYIAKVGGATYETSNYIMKYSIIKKIHTSYFIKDHALFQ